MHCAVDLRKAFDSGIGTYIRHVVPQVVQMLPDVRFTGFVKPGTATQHGYVAGLMNYREIRSLPLGLSEQIELRRGMRDCDLFWATSLAHPLYTRRPFVATLHDVAQLALGGASGGSLPVRVASRIYFRSLRARARTLFVNSDFTGQEFARRVGTRRGLAIVLTPLGVDEAWFGSASAAAPRAPYFVCVGNLRPHKNLRVLLSAFEGVSHLLPHDLVVVGQHRGFRTADAGLVAAMERVGPRVRFAGHLADDELRSCVAGAQALVFPSLYEGFGLPALEAMAAGCLVVAARAAALPEVCGDAALYFDPTSSEDLARVLLTTARLVPDERAALVEGGLTRARSFTWERTATLTAAALRQAAADLQRRGSPAVPTTR